MVGKVKVFLFALLGLMMVALPLVLSCTEDRQPAREKNISEGAAPDFSLKDLNGGSFQLSAQRGKPVLLIFLTTWCPTCRTEIPHYKSIHETYSRRGLEVVSINIQEQKERVSRFAKNYRLPYKTLLDETGDVAGTYGVVGVPTMILIDKDGMILSREYFAVDTILETMLAKK